MHRLVFQAQLERVLRREKEGDCPSTAPLSVEQLEDLAVELHRRHESSLENCRMQLAAISTAACGNTKAQVERRLTPQDTYWTQTYQDVCDAVDREMALREALLDSPSPSTTPVVTSEQARILGLEEIVREIIEGLVETAAPYRTRELVARFEEFVDNRDKNKFESEGSDGTEEA